MALNYERLPVGKFRLFELEGDRGGRGPPTGRLCTFDVDAPNPPDFRVISYLWGAGSEGSGYIVCDGQQIHARPNLIAALGTIPRSRRQLLWIDAICINQQDAAEKSQQLEMCRTIMSIARAVMLYVNSESESTRAALQLAAQLIAANRAVFGPPSASSPWPWQFRIEGGESKMIQTYRKALPSPKSAAWTAMNRLLGEAVFARYASALCSWQPGFLIH
jgi:hypothetical protein